MRSYCLIGVIFWLFLSPSVSTAHVEGLFLRNCSSLLLDLFPFKASVSKAQKSAEIEETLWAEQEMFLFGELQKFQKFSELEAKEHLQAVSKQVEDKLRSNLGHSRIGAHFNLHGGQKESYVSGGGIRAQVGDSGLQHGFSRDFHRKVYFFNLENRSLLETLSERNPDHLFRKVRMGRVLILFNLEHESLKLAQNLSVSFGETAISLNFDEAKAQEFSLFHGIPVQSFLSSPLRVFESGDRPESLRRLSWDEETLITLHFLDIFFERYGNGSAIE
jgi:hypothetical protein